VSSKIQASAAMTPLPLRRSARSGSEVEFLPAALEIQETPPSPLGRAVLWVILGLCVTALAWASLGEVDIVAVAPGKLVPSDRVKVIQAHSTRHGLCESESGVGRSESGVSDGAPEFHVFHNVVRCLQPR
jgi:hypothetical protein